MKNFLLGALATFVLGALAAGGLLYAGAFDVAADAPHAPAVHRLIEWARERAVARRAAGIAPPADLADAGRIRRGAGNYDAMCANCHLVPGADDSEIRRGLSPMPPNLAQPDGRAGEGGERDDARRFWIVKRGIQATGMPAWGRGGMDDQAIWDLAAFLKALPGLSASDYRRLVAASPGHSHAGLAAPAAEQAGRRESDEAHAESAAHSTHAHPHKAGAHAH